MDLPGRSREPPVNLVADEMLWINFDDRPNGLGSASCGTGVPPACRRGRKPVVFSVLRAVA
jgi:hypothetical protein